MSYLNSILSSLNTTQRASPGTGASQSPTPTPTTKQIVARSVTDNGSTSQPSKRKAEGDLGTTTAKLPRKDGQLNGIEKYAGTARPSATPPVSRPSSAGPDSLPQRGTAKSGVSASSAVRTTAKPSLTSTNASAGSRPPSKPTTPVSAVPAPAPKPGSYQAMLARAKAVQQTQPIVGAIKHKQTEKLTRRELLAQKAEAAKQHMTAKSKQPVTNGRSSKSENNAKPGDNVREKKKGSDLSYQGTMRPKAAETTYTGTMRPGGPSKASKRSNERPFDGNNGRRPGEKPRNTGYTSYSDEEEDNYESDVSSDMEAGAFDLDEEENFSLRQAKKEDEEALRQENELKRQKELRKQQMQKLVEQANAKKKRF